jgi:hypothetical protein
VLLNQIRCIYSVYSKMGYKKLTRKEQIEALRKGGLDWMQGEPRRWLQPKWLPSVNDPAWLTIEAWIAQANLLTPEETLAAEPSSETLSRLPPTNFEIRNYRGVEPEFLFDLIRKVRNTLDSVIARPRPKGIDHVEPTPHMLFLVALGMADLARIQRCAKCEKFFYAKREDQVACSLPCSNAVRQQRSRDRRKVYEQNRKATKKRAEQHKQAKLKWIRQQIRKPR